MNRYELVGFNAERKRQERERWRILGIRKVTWEVETNGGIEGVMSVMKAKVEAVKLLKH